MADGLPGTIVAPVGGGKADTNLPGTIIGPAPGSTSSTVVPPSREMPFFTGLLSGKRRDVGVDYGPGLGFETEEAVKRVADRGDEAVRTVLENRYGPDTAFKDDLGNWYVSQNGIKTAVFGDKSSLAKRAATSTLSVAPQTTGMAAGAAAGAALGGPFAWLTAPIGAGVGAVAGKGISDYYDYLSEGITTSPEKEQAELGQEFLWSMGGESGVRALSMFGRTALKPKNIPWVHITPEMEAREADLRSRGIVPTIEQAAPGNYMLGVYHQKLTQLIWGTAAEKRNVEALNKQLIQKLQDAGVPPDQVDSTLQSIVRKEIPMVLQNQKAVDAVTNYSKGLVTVSDNAAKTAKSALDSQLRDIDRSLSDPGVDLSDKISNDITTARDQFGKDSQRLYQLVDEMAGGRDLVPTVGIKQQVKDILDSLPRTADKEMATDEGTQTVRGRILGSSVESPTMEYLKDLGQLPDSISLRDAARIRSGLLRRLDDRNLTPHIGAKELNDIRDSIDVAIDQIGLSSESPEVLNAFRSANKFYSEGIEKFKDTLANRLVKEAGVNRGAVEPEKVLDTIVRGGKVAQAQRIMNFMSPTTKDQLRRDYFDDIINRAADPADARNVIGRRLLHIVGDDKGSDKDMLKAVYGPAFYNKLRQFAVNAANFDGTLPISGLSPDRVGYYIQTMKAAQSVRDSFMKDNYLSALTEPGAMRSQAIDYLTSGRNIEQLKKAEAIPGVKPVLQQTVMQKILSSATRLDPDQRQIFTGGALNSELQSWGKEYLTELYGSDVVDDLFRLGDSISTISSQRPGHMVGFVAGTAIMLHPLTPNHLKALIGTGLMSRYLFSQPGFTKWLVQGYEGDSNAMQVVAKTLQNAMRFGTQAGIQPPP